MALGIRLATLADLPELRRLWRDYVLEARPAYPIDMLGSIDVFTRHLALALAAEPPAVTCFVATDADDPVGFCVYEIQQRSYGEPERFGFVHYVYVAPAQRAHGVGNQLLLLAAEHAVAQGLAYAEMTAVAGDTQWERLGWTPYEQRYFIPLPTVLASLQRRQQEAVAKRGNGLDHDAIPAPAIPRPDPLVLEADDEPEEPA